VREVRRTAQGHELTLLIDSSLPYFAGHFPDHPILAGVVQLEWAELFGRERFGIVSEFSGLEAIKFQRVITAKQREVTLSLAWGAGCLGFRYDSERGQHASGRLRFDSR
jgi:3-hydroxymyristoyl/3-hydroxydecanoyl-(acyl carrier protein) dehydratase